MESDDESLPEVSFDPSPRVDSSEENNSSPPRATSYSAELAKINAYSRRIEENCKFEKNKAELEDLIRKDGFQFDERAQIREIPTDDREENLELNEGQRHILNQLNKCNEDPIIPFNPELEELFDLNACRIVFNEYPIEAFTRSFVANLNHPNVVKSNIANQVSQLVDPEFFSKFYEQIPSEKLRNAVLDCLFLNIPWFTSCLKGMIASEILSELLHNQRNSENKGSWRITPQMLFRYLKSMGLKTHLLEARLPSIFSGLKSISHSISEMSSIGKFVVEPQEVETINEDCFQIGIQSLLSLLYMSLRPGPDNKSLYSTAELDIMFVLLIYMCMDQEFDLQFGTEHRLAIQLLISNYPDALWDTMSDKSKELCSYVYVLHGLDLIDDASDSEETDKSEQLVLGDSKQMANEAEAPSKNLLYHRIYYLTSHLGYSQENKANKFRNDLAYYAACNLLMSFNPADDKEDYMDTSSSEDESDKTLLFIRKHLTDNYLDYKHLAAMALEKFPLIYMNNTYTMHNLIRLFEVVIADIAMSPIDQELKTRVLEQIKEAVQSSNRSVKDKLEYQGRMQVKIMNSNFISKCDYYLKEFTRKSSKYVNLILNENRHRHFGKAATLAIGDDDDKENDQFHK